MDSQTETTVARTIAFRELTGPDGTYRMYVEQPGFTIWKGMYRNRRPRGHKPTIWTKDVARARLFTSPSNARKHCKRELQYGLQFATVKATCTIFQWGSRRHWGNFKLVQP